MNTETETKQYRGHVFVTEPGQWLRGGCKDVFSVWFDSESDAQAWVSATAHGYPSNVKIHGRIRSRTTK